MCCDARFSVRQKDERVGLKRGNGWTSAFPVIAESGQRHGTIENGIKRNAEHIRFQNEENWWDMHIVRNNVTDSATWVDEQKWTNNVLIEINWRISVTTLAEHWNNVGILLSAWSNYGEAWGSLLGPALHCVCGPLAMLLWSWESKHWGRPAGPYFGWKREMRTIERQQ